MAYPAPLVPAGQPPPQPPPAQAPGGVVALMREDANKRAMDVVARTGPAKVLAYSVAGLSVAAAAATAFVLVPLGFLPLAGLWSLVPMLGLAGGAGWVGRRMGAGVSSHHLEQAILRVAAQHDGQLRVVTLAQATGRPLRECQIAIDAMVASGHATVDADASGALVYTIPELEPAKPKVIYDVEERGGGR
jgi:hypothetical protein